VTDTELPDESTPAAPQPGKSAAFWVGIGAAAFVVLAAVVTVVLIVAIGVLRNGALPPAAASTALLTARDLAHVAGTGIAIGRNSEITKSSVPAYVLKNGLGDPSTVTPSGCADNLEGWLAWAALDTPSSPGWKHDVIYAANNIIVDSATEYGDNIQQARHFVSAAAATAFMNAQRSWYRECASATYADGTDSNHTSSFNFSPLPVKLGLDSIIEGSNDTGRNLPPHLVDLYLRNRNIVYVLEIATTHSPKDGLDTVSLGIVRAAENKVGGLG
jgi:hypothetical protein